MAGLPKGERDYRIMTLEKVSLEELHSPAATFRFSDELSSKFASFTRRYNKPLDDNGLTPFYATSSFSVLGAGTTLFIHQPVIASLFTIPAVGSYVFSKVKHKRYQKKYAINFEYHETLDKMVDELGIWMYKTYGLGFGKGIRLSHINKEFKNFVEMIIDGDEKKPNSNILYNRHLPLSDVETGEEGVIDYWVRVEATSKGFSINVWKRHHGLNLIRIAPAEKRESLQKKRLSALSTSNNSKSISRATLSSDVPISVKKRIQSVQKEYDDLRSEKYSFTAEEEYAFNRVAEDLDNVISSANLLARYKSSEDTNMVNDILTKLSSELREISNQKQEEIRKNLKIQASYIKSR